jgi:hypothetical protein
MYNFDLKTLKF